MRDAQAVRDRPACLRGESRAQCLPLLGILREPRLLLGMCGKIGVDVLGALARQLSVNAGMQVVLFYGPTQPRHLTLLSSALWRRRSPFTSPFIWCRSRSRPRDSRDITVPIGTPSTRAASW